MTDHEHDDRPDTPDDLSGLPDVSGKGYKPTNEPQALFYSINIQVVMPGPTGPTVRHLASRGSLTPKSGMSTVELVDLLVHMCIAECREPQIAAHAEQLSRSAMVTNLTMLPNDPAQINRDALR
ncbi:hypothetical protein QZH56_30255 [Streptomyces olivoreticuli]|uniref:hypothetical protein n=1 Tax=Streptomyces olivoreticuli TaxID=68246 RepID=UPI00265A644A|nr:hypothetical protein [Streptomyces olivoreticuli]WKK22987.1 hypothetical protein QZH56_30255 [Streptomyces olivoreticuli]